MKVDHLKHNFCCDSMFEAVKEDKIVEYSYKMREYGILFRKNRIKMLSFCPWCGVKLQKSLVREFFNILENEYGMSDEMIVKDDFAHVPDEFKTDEWWKKRSL